MVARLGAHTHTALTHSNDNDLWCYDSGRDPIPSARARSRNLLTHKHIVKVISRKVFGKHLRAPESYLAT